jgi:hypothetical protein
VPHQELAAQERLVARLAVVALATELLRCV